MKPGTPKLLVCFSAIAIYFLTWAYSGELGITRPMANLRYFYYGSGPDSGSDRLLYRFYYPVYRMHLFIEDYQHEGRDFVHWSDRRD